jgi:hypothetical protein
MIARVRTNKELDAATLAAVEAAVDRGLSARAGALECGVDRKTYERVRHGLHVSDRLGKRYQRCRCGHKVVMPCKICAARQFLEQAPCAS